MPRGGDMSSHQRSKFVYLLRLGLHFQSATDHAFKAKDDAPGAAANRIEEHDQEDLQLWAAIHERGCDAVVPQLREAMSTMGIPGPVSRMFMTEEVLRQWLTMTPRVSHKGVVTWLLVSTMSLLHPPHFISSALHDSPSS